MKAATIALLVTTGLLTACATSPRSGRTSLSDPSATFEVIKEPSVAVQWGSNMRAVLAGNQAMGTHREGYNGLVELHHGDGPSPFVAAYAGLNLEHVLNGKASEDKAIQFEPRRHPMELRRIKPGVYELYQAPLPTTGVETCTRFEFKDPYYIDVTVECIPRQDNFPYGYLNLFWASYIDSPRDNAINFLGRLKGDDRVQKWIKAVSAKHGEKSTHISALDRRDFDHDDPFPLTLVFNQSDYEYSQPFYYGRYEKNVWAVMFNAKDRVRFTQSPSGGGENNPAWDFQWFIDRPIKDKLYRMSYRALYKPWVDQKDIHTEYTRYRHGN